MERLDHIQVKFLKDVVVFGKWMFNQETGLVDVDGNVKILPEHIHDGRLPVRFGTVTGAFNCAKCNLVSLEGTPRTVGLDFICGGNLLVDLVGSPECVYGNFICTGNKLKTLKGGPITVGGNCKFTLNRLERLEWCPAEVGGSVWIELSYIKKKYRKVIIPEIEKMISIGIVIKEPELNYTPYRSLFLEREFSKNKQHDASREVFLNEVVNGRWSVNPDTGLVDVDGNVYLDRVMSDRLSLPIRFGSVSGDFIVSGKLTSMKGFPKIVGDSVSVNLCKMKQLNWEPDEIKIMYLHDSFSGFYNSISDPYPIDAVVLVELIDLHNEGKIKSIPSILKKYYNQYLNEKMIELL